MSPRTTRPPPRFRAKSHMDDARYEAMYQHSVADPDAFWAAQAEQFVDWFSGWREVSSHDFANGRVRWFEGATLNACYNCVDRHLPQRAEQPPSSGKATIPTPTRPSPIASLRTP